jgi:hypothetical protein
MVWDWMGVGVLYPADDIPALICGRNEKILKLTIYSFNGVAIYAKN